MAGLDRRLNKLADLAEFWAETLDASGDVKGARSRRIGSCAALQLRRIASYVRTGLRRGGVSSVANIPELITVRPHRPADDAFDEADAKDNDNTVL